MKKKYRVILGGAAALIVIAVFVFQGLQALEVKTLRVEPQVIAKTFKEEGVVVTTQDTLVYAAVAGKIIDIPVREGQSVRQGELLVALDTQPLDYQLEELTGQLRSLQAQQELEAAVIAPDKLQQLYEAGAISRKEYEDAKRKIESDYYPGQIAALNAQIKAVQYQIDQSSVKAAHAGVISQLDVKEGMVITPGTFLMNLFSEDSFQVEAYVLTEDVARMSVGQEVELIQDNKAEDLSFTGMIESIAPSAVEKVSALGLKEQRVKILIKPLIPEKLQLKPGFALDINFTVDRQEDQLVVPKTVLFPYQDGEGVWVIDGSKAKVRAVKRGFENDKEAAITEGLQSGDRVILNPQLAGLKEGAKVIPVE